MSPGWGYIAVEGPIGVGKTTLTHRLAATFEARTLLESPEDNPFLGSFYRAPEANALITQLAFLLQRVRQLEDIRDPSLFPRPCITDFMFEKDTLFAELTLDRADLTLYRQLHERLQWSDPSPDRVIYLHAPVDVLMQRIRQRGRAAEQMLQRAYLERVSEAYRRFFVQYRGAPLVVVDAAKLDLKSDAADYQQLLDAVENNERFVTLPPSAMF